MFCIYKQRRSGAEELPGMPERKTMPAKTDMMLLAAATMLFVVFLAAAVSPVISSYRSAPCRVEADCRFKKVQMEEILALQEQEKENGGMTGLRAVSAWRYGEAGKVTEPLMGKHQETGAVYICGAMSVAFPDQVLSGSYEQSMRQGDCVVTKELSNALFGSVDTAGCKLMFEGKSYRIAAVTDRKEKLIMIPEEEGRVEMAAFLFENRERLKEKMEALGFELS